MKQLEIIQSEYPESTIVQKLSNAIQFYDKEHHFLWFQKSYTESKIRNKQVWEFCKQDYDDFKHIKFVEL